MNIRDLKIGTQLKLGFGIIVFLIVILSAMAFRTNIQLARQTTELEAHPFTVTKAIGKLNFDVVAMRLEFRNLMLATNQNSRQKALANSDLYEADARKQFEILYDRYLGPQSDIKNAEEGFIKWVSVRKTNREVKDASEAMSRLEASGDIGMEREKMLDDIRKIEDFAARKSEEFSSNAVELRQSLNLRLEILVAGILLLSFLIVFILNRIIHKPVDELTQLAQLFKNGQMSVRSHYVSANEYGFLSSTFNEMADNIESEMALSNQAAKLSGVMLSKDDARPFCHDLLGGLLESTGSQTGAIYLLNDGKTEFTAFECIGMDSEQCIPFSATRFDGEFGQALSTKKLQLIKNIPEDTRFTFSTVGGKFIPREIITIPIVSGGEIIAVISLATIKSFGGNTLRLLNTILITLSARLDGILAYRKIVAFSHQLEQQNTELELQKRELSLQTNLLTEQNTELEMQKKQLDEANRMKTSFLSNMSHELRTPLNSVIALSGVLNRHLAGKVPDQEYRYLDVIERNGKQLLKLINDILDLSRIEAGREELEISAFKVDSLLHEVVETINPQAAQKNISLNYTAASDIPEIRSDYEKCRHIVQNLVANAVKFTEEGKVDLKAEEMGGMVHIAIADTGIGISKDHLPHIFDEFRQADGSSSRKYGGTGLGLAIAKKYTQLLGGSIRAHSVCGEGSTFTLVLPLQLAGQPLVHESLRIGPEDIIAKTDRTHEDFNPAGKTILLVEDTEPVAIQMSDMLSSEGYRISVAPNGAEALAMIGNKVPDAIILDLMMPGMDGFEVLRRIRENRATERLPVIILTAKYVTKEELATLKYNHIHQLIRKGDINKAQLLEAVSGMLFKKVAEENAPGTKPLQKQIQGKPVVLVVEDNDDNMLTIKVLLGEKCTVIEAGDGATAIEMARLHQPHLILMDFALPGMNGMDALAKFRELKGLGQVPVIAVSASAMKGDRENFILHGFDDYISKPIDHVHFEKTLSKWFAKISN